MPERTKLHIFSRETGGSRRSGVTGRLARGDSGARVRMLDGTCLAALGPVN